MFGVLRDRRMQYLLTANVVSSIGSGITMVGIPWLLVTRQNGDQIYGYATLGLTIFLFLVAPYVGVAVDRFSRKKILLLGEWMGLGIVSLFAIWGYLSGHFAVWQLITMYFAGSLYYSIHITAQFAFNQEIFEPSQYQSLNSVMEVQSQIATMTAGGLAGLLIDQVDLSLILLIDACTYLVAIICLSLIPYKSSIIHNAKNTFWTNIKEGFNYQKGKRLLNLFFICSFMPFICVMVGNYLFPVFITKILHANGTIFGFSSLLFAIGATVGGLTIPFLMKKIGTYQTLLLSVLVYTIGIFATAWLPLIVMFMALKIPLGWGNSAARVSRNSIMMEVVPNQLMGRVNSFYSVIGLVIRIILIGFFTKTIVYLNASIAVSVLGLLMVLAIVGVLMGRKLFEKREVVDHSKASTTTV